MRDSVSISTNESADLKVNNIPSFVQQNILGFYYYSAQIGDKRLVKSTECWF